MNPIVDNYLKAEDELLRITAEYLGKHNDLADVDINRWEIQKLNQLGSLTDKQIEILAKHSKTNAKDLKKWIGKEVDKSLVSVKRDVLTVKDKFVIDNNLLWRDLFYLEENLMDTYGIINNHMLYESRAIYRKAVNDIVTDMKVSNKSVYDSLFKVAKEWGDKGIPAFTDKIGRKYTPEAYVTMVAKAQEKRIMSMVKDRGYDENDIDLVEVDSLADSRPSHVPFEGRIYSRSGRSKIYPPLAETGYGEVDGIETGINCRHRIYPYIPGTEKTYEPNETAEEIQEKQIEYEISQKQRQYERGVREAKRRKELAKEMNLTDKELEEATNLVTQRQKRLREFTKANNRKRNYKRERIL